MIQILYDKWWKNTGDVCNRDEKSKESKANALGVENIGEHFRSGVTQTNLIYYRTFLTTITQTKTLSAMRESRTRDRDIYKRSLVGINFFNSISFLGPRAGGVFVVLLCGLALAIIVAVLEFCWNSRKNAQTDRVR